MNQEFESTRKQHVITWVWSLRWVVAFGLIIVVALGARLPRVDIGHEDEVYTIGRSMNIIYTGEFKPGFYLYPTGPIYLTLLADMVALGGISRETSNGPISEGGMTPLFRLRATYQEIVDPWVFREASDPLLDAFLAKVRTVFLVFIPAQILLLAYIGWRLNLMGAAWVAALFLACSPSSIIESSYVAVNTPSGFFLLLAVAVMVFLATRTSVASACQLWWHVAAIGFVCGLAVSCKYNAGVALLMPWIYAALVLKSQPGIVHRFETWLMAVMVSILALAIGFTVLTPFWFWEFEIFARDVLQQVWHNQTGHAPWNTFEPGLTMLWFNTQAITDQIGWLGLLLFIASLGIIGWRQMKTGAALSVQLRVLIPALIVCVAFFALMSKQAVFFDRNFSIIWPVLFFCIASSWWLAMDALIEALGLHWLMRYRAAIGIALGLLCVLYALVIDPLVFPREWWRKWWEM